MKTLNILGACFCFLLTSTACTSLLDQNPQGIISDEDLNTPDKAEQMVNAAYSFCGQNHFNKQFGMPYEEGSLRGGEAIKELQAQMTTQNVIYGKHSHICSQQQLVT